MITGLAILLVVLALTGGGGWWGYQRHGPVGVAPAFVVGVVILVAFFLVR